jgi:hypothetical protein
VTRCDMPPGPEAVQCEAWAQAQVLVAAVPKVLPFAAVVWLVAVFIWASMRVQVPR